MAGKIRTFIGKKQFREWNEYMSSKFDPDLFYAYPNILVRSLEKKRLRCILDFLSLEGDDTILDLGCGSGKLFEGVDASKVVGIDISDYLLKKAKSRIKYILKAEGESLPFKNESFNKIICSEVIEHLLNPGIVMKEAKRVLKKKGALIITIPNEKNINFLKRFFIKPTGTKSKSDSYSYKIPREMDEEWHLHSFDLLKFKNYIHDDFRVRKIRYLPFWVFPLRYVISCEQIA
ncbi:MAG: class I SAM-dependent methyltransferase [Candidatus Omnitrophica bacterium]|nr:class I SAM-dependent methyltransferase [Candidatus Omnitrophota bacterium]